MMAHGREESVSPAELGVIVVGVLLIGLLGAVLYQRYRVPINEAWLGLIRGQVALFAWIDGSEAQALYRWAAAARPETLHWEHMTAAAKTAGRWMRFLNLVVLVPLALIVWRYTDRRRLFRKRFSMRELLARNLPLFPCIAPALRRNLLKASLHAGPWAVAQSPIRFVADHALLLDREGNPVPRAWLLTADGLPNEDSPLQQQSPTGAHAAAGFRFDREKAERLFTAQLGARFSSLDRLPRHRQALAAAFLAFAHAKREEAQRFLDQLSISFREPRQPNAPVTLDTAGMEALLNKYPATERMARRLERHAAYATTWLVALLDCAREKGLLPPAEFLWLRPIDRSLWYALNQAGGRMPWTEAAGIWAHYEAEELLRAPLATPEIGAAIDALEASLLTSGWLPEPPEKGRAA